MTTRLRTRGFLLIDVMIAGALAAVVIGSVLSVLANARSKNVAAARDVIATQLVLEKLDQVRSLPFGSLAGAAGTEATVPNVTGKYARVTAVTASANETVSSTAMPFRDVTVTVTYTSDAFGPGAGTRATQATTRVYQ